MEFLVTDHSNTGANLANANLEKRLGDTLSELKELKYALDQTAIVAITDLAGRITYANDRFCYISQYSRDELLGKLIG